MLEQISNLYNIEPVQKIEEQSVDDLVDRTLKVINICQQNGLQPLLVGSLGRCSAIAEPIDTIKSKSRRYKDIDLFILGNQNIIIPSEARQVAHPFEADIAYRQKTELRDGNVYICYKDIRIPVDPVVFEPREGNLEGHPIQTLDPNTLFHMTVLYGMFRRQDYESLITFKRKLRHRDDLLPEQLFTPFHEMISEIKNNYPRDRMADQLRWVYRDIFSMEVRDKLSPVVHKVANLIRHA